MWALQGHQWMGGSAQGCGPVFHCAATIAYLHPKGLAQSIFDIAYMTQILSHSLAIGFSANTDGNVVANSNKSEKLQTLIFVPQQKNTQYGNVRDREQFLKKQYDNMILGNQWHQRMQIHIWSQTYHDLKNLCLCELERSDNLASA